MGNKKSVPHTIDSAIRGNHLPFLEPGSSDSRQMPSLS